MTVLGGGVKPPEAPNRHRSLGVVHSLVVSGYKLISMPPTPHECITSICIGKEEFTLGKLEKYI